MRKDLETQLSLLLDMNKDNIISYKNTFNKSYCGDCIEGKIFDPYKRVYNNCEFCDRVKEHNFKLINRNIKSSDFGITDDNLKSKVDKLSEAFKSGKFVGCSCILDISSGFNLEDYKLFIEGINSFEEFNITYLDGKELFDKKDYNSYINTSRLILVLYNDITYEYIDVIKGLLERRSDKNLSTLVLSRHKVNNFFSQIVTKEYRNDLLYIL